MIYETGKYVAQIVSAEAVQIGKNNTPCLSVEINVTHIFNQTLGDWAEVANGQRYMKMFLSEKAWPYTEKKLEAMGFNGDFQAPEFDETQIVVECTYDEYDGKTRENWELHSDTGPSAAPKDTLRVLNARWANKHKGGQSLPPGARSEDVPSVDINDDLKGDDTEEKPDTSLPPADDIPF